MKKKTAPIATTLAIAGQLTAAHAASITSPLALLHGQAAAAPQESLPLTRVCIGSVHPDRAKQIDALRKAFPDMNFEEQQLGPLARSFARRATSEPVPTQRQAEIDAAVQTANAATPSSGCNQTEIKATPKRPTP